MKDLQYLRPVSLEEALEILHRYGRDVRVLAGGTDLIVALRDRTAECSYLMDIKAVKGLQEIACTDVDGLSIGAGVCLNDIIYSDDVKKNYPILVDAAKNLANTLLRNRATLVGNICTASPGGDMLSPSIVLDGQVSIASKQGTRSMALKDFITGVKKNALGEGELVTHIKFPSVKGKGVYLKKSRIKGHDLAQVGVAAFLKAEGGLRLSITAAGPTPVAIGGFEDCKRADISGRKPEIIKKVLEEIRPISDQRASREFRTAIVEYLTLQALEELEKEA